jgi:hypothetical protein
VTRHYNLHVCQRTASAQQTVLYSGLQHSEIHICFVCDRSVACSGQELVQFSSQLLLHWLLTPQKHGSVSYTQTYNLLHLLLHWYSASKQ